MTTSLRSSLDLDDIIAQIRTDCPVNLQRQHILQLLCDQGRNEIHTLVSLCTEGISKWSGIVKTLERCFTFANLEKKEFALDVLNENDDYFVYKLEELEAYLEAKKCLALLKHKLKILEMIVEAQGSLRRKYNTEKYL